MDPALLAKINAYKKNLGSFSAQGPAQPRGSYGLQSSSQSAFRPISSGGHLGLNRPVSSSHDRIFENERNLVKKKIITQLQENHKEGNNEALSLDDLKDELKIEINTNQRNWLEGENGLAASERVLVILPPEPTTQQQVQINLKQLAPEPVKYRYKPIFDVSDRESILKLLKDHNRYQLGGVSRDDLLDAMPDNKVDKAIKKLKKQDKIYEIETHEQKKKIVYFYKEKFQDANNADLLKLDDNHLALWRNVAVLEDTALSSFLKRNKLTEVRNSDVVRVMAEKGKGKKRKAKQQVTTRNNRV